MASLAPTSLVSLEGVATFQGAEEQLGGGSMARQLKNLVIKSWGKTQALTESFSLNQGLDFLSFFF